STVDRLRRLKELGGAEALKAGMQDVRNAAMEELQATRREIDGARKDAVQKLEADAVALRRAAESLRQQMEEGLEKVHKEMEIAMRGETEARGNELKHTRGAVEQVEKDIQVLRTDMLHRDVRHGDALKHSADLLENQLDSGLERVHNSSRQLTEELAKNLDTANTRLEGKNLAAPSCPANGGLHQPRVLCVTLAAVCGDSEGGWL
ncbi:hypothetical protein CYMTET_35921, partial [Cymbomonas tetramitiformis]